MSELILNLKTNNIKILVVGDLILDKFFVCKTERKSSEVNINVHEIEGELSFLGGAGNVYKNVIGFSADATLCTAVGKDNNGVTIKKSVKDHLFIDSNFTTCAHRFYANGYQVFRADKTNICKFSSNAYLKLLNKIKEKIDFYDAIIISDYRRGFCDKFFISNLINIAKEKSIYIVADSKSNDISKFYGINLLKVNRKEFKEMFYEDIKTIDQSKIIDVLKENNLDNLLVTLGSEGMILVNQQNKVIFSKSEEVKNADVIGAGDCALVSFVISKLNGYSDDNCMKVANMVASYCVSEKYTSVFDIEKYKERYYE